MRTAGSSVSGALSTCRVQKIRDCWPIIRSYILVDTDRPTVYIIHFANAVVHCVIFLHCGWMHSVFSRTEIAASLTCARIDYDLNVDP